MRPLQWDRGQMDKGQAVEEWTRTKTETRRTMTKKRGPGYLNSQQRLRGWMPILDRHYPPSSGVWGDECRGSDPKGNRGAENSNGVVAISSWGCLLLHAERHLRVRGEETKPLSLIYI